MTKELTQTQRRILSSIASAPSYQYRLADDLRLSRSTVYGALVRLYADGLIDTWDHSRYASRRKQYYRITSKGMEALRQHEQER